MKQLFFFLLLASLLFTTACNSSRSASQVPAKQEEIKDFSTLQVRLQRTPGVFFVNGEVRIRGGANSFNSDSEPLFEINGQVLQGGYSRALQMVSPMEIKSIEVLK
ncbi:MAG: Plug domain-containing protein, partial [Bacteroidota bacterium]